MPRTRAYRRRQRAVNLRRCYHLVRRLVVGLTLEPDPRWRHRHINCACFDIDTPRAHRSRDKRHWRVDIEDQLNGYRRPSSWSLPPPGLPAECPREVSTLWLAAWKAEPGLPPRRLTDAAYAPPRPGPAAKDEPSASGGGPWEPDVARQRLRGFLRDEWVP